MKNEINWVMVQPRSLSAKDRVTVGFTDVKTGGNRTAFIRIGSLIYQQMGWKEKDRIGVYFNPDDPTHWMLCKASNGNVLAVETNSPEILRLNITWREKIDNLYIKARIVSDLTIKKDLIELKLPVD